MTADESAIAIPPEAERLRDALQDVACCAVHLLNNASKAKSLLDRRLEPHAEDWPSDTIIGADEPAPGAVESNEDEPTDDCGWRPVLLTLREDLLQFWSAHDHAQAAITALSAGIVRILHEAGASHWTVRVRRTLDTLGHWHYWTRPCRTKVGTYPPNVVILIGLLREGLPDWSQPLTSFGRFQDDLYALRGKNPTQNPSADRVTPRWPLQSL